MTYEDLVKANQLISTMGIERYDKKAGKKVTKEYAEVNQRIKAFRSVYPDGFILTNIESLENGVCLMTARVGYYDDGNTVILGMGHAQEKENASDVNKTSYVENCETSAIGRALGMCGFGIDTSIASFEEVTNAIKQQEKDQPAAKPAEKPAEKAPESPEEKALDDSTAIRLQKVTTTQVEALMQLVASTKANLDGILACYNVQSLADMTNGQWDDCMRILSRRKDGKGNTAKG